MNRKPKEEGQINSNIDRSLNRTVTYDDIDTAHLLSNHHSPRGQCRTTDPRDREELAKAFEVVGFTDEVRLDFDLGIDIVEISSGK